MNRWVFACLALVVVVLGIRPLVPRGKPERTTTTSTSRIKETMRILAQQDRVISRLRSEVARIEAGETPPPRREVPPSRTRRIAHVINPMPAGHGLHADQEITFASMAAAKGYAAERGIEVELLSADIAGDARAPRPAVFGTTPNLTRHAHEVYEMRARGIPERGLPLVGDVLGAAFEATRRPGDEGCASSPERGEDILMIYTNADIGVQRDFYAVVDRIAAETEAFAINRVEVPDGDASGRPFGAKDLEVLYELGKARPQLHAGYDCFVWRRRLTPLLRLYARGVFVGYPPVGKHLRDALSCVATSFREIRGKKHTFHVGDRNGGWSQYPEYEHFNRKAARRAEKDFAKIARSCAAAKKARGDLLCRVGEELEVRSFLRWDRPGTEWPPIPAA